MKLLPKLGRYVLVHYSGGNWIDGQDQVGCEWVVACRKTDDNDDPDNEWFWDTFGADEFEQDDVDIWLELPKQCRLIGGQK